MEKSNLKKECELAGVCPTAWGVGEGANNPSSFQERVRKHIEEITEKYLERTTDVNQFGLNETLYNFITFALSEQKKLILESLPEMKEVPLDTHQGYSIGFNEALDIVRGRIENL